MNVVWWFDEDDDPNVSQLGRMLTATEAEKYLGIPATRVRKWAERRSRTGLHSMGLGWRDHPLYWEADLVALSLGVRIRDEEGNRTIFAVPGMSTGDAEFRTLR